MNSQLTRTSTANEGAVSRPPPRERRFRPGFTLVEVLVVVAMIALLLAILLPSLAKAREAAHAAACLNNLHVIGPAIAMYADVSRGYAPFLGKMIGEPTGMPQTPEYMLGKEVEFKWGVFQCPSNPSRRTDFFFWTAASGQPWPWPGAPKEVSYMWSEQLLRGFYEDYPSSLHPDSRCTPPWKAVPFERSTLPHRRGLLADGGHIFNAWRWRTLDPKYLEDCRLGEKPHGTKSNPRVNMLFGDIHADSIPCNETKLRTISSAPFGPDPW